MSQVLAFIRACTQIFRRRAGSKTSGATVAAAVVAALAAGRSGSSERSLIHSANGDRERICLDRRIGTGSRIIRPVLQSEFSGLFQFGSQRLIHLSEQW